MSRGPRTILGGSIATLSFFRDPIGFMDRLFANYGQFVHVRTASMATPPSPDYPGTVFIYGPELISQVSTAHDTFHRVAMSHRLYPTGEVSPRQQPLLRIMTGLPHLKRGDHRRHRRLMMPAFDKLAIGKYLPDIVSATEHVLDGWAQGEVINVSQEMLDLTMWISAATLFGRLGADEGKRVGSLVDEWIDFVMSVSHLFPIDFPGTPYRRWLNLSAEIEAATRAIVADNRSADVADASLLSKLIAAREEDGQALSEDDLIGHISLLLWGSRDATAAALTWTFFLLSQHPGVASHLVDELDATLSGAPPTIEDFESLPLLDRVIKESLRLLPPFPVNHRVASEDAEIGGHSIQKGTEIAIGVYQTHRIPDLYPKPAQFDPDRWLGVERTVYEFTPFGGGPRMCIGNSFAMLELKTIISMLMQRYRLELVDRTKIDRNVEVTLMPKKGLPMVVRPQDRQFHLGVGEIRGSIGTMVDLSR